MNNRGISLLASALVVLVASSGAPAQTHLSARMYSLGGESVAGIVPDLYTDIDINPAYASFAEGFTINYGRRSAPAFNTVFPYVTGSNSGRYYYTRGSYPTNQLSLQGLRLARWSFALSAEFGVDDRESNSTDLGVDIYSSSYQQRSYQSLSDATEDFWRLDVAVGRPFGDRCTLGLRLRGYGYYDTHSGAQLNYREEYSNSSFLQVRSRSSDRSGYSELGRQNTIDLEMGIIRTRDSDPRSEAVVRVSVTPIDLQAQDYDLSTYEGYNSAQELDRYSYHRSLWSDCRSGNVWTYGLSLRHVLPRGIRVFGGGSLSTASYDASWSDARETAEWSTTSWYDETLSSDFSGDGSLRAGNAFLRFGRTFSVHRNLDVLVGLSTGFARESAEESPLIRFAREYRSNRDTAGVQADLPSRLKYTRTRFGAYVPLSMEFRPSQFFSFFAGLTIYGTWSKTTTERSLPSFFDYGGPDTRADTSTLFPSPLRMGARSLAPAYPEGSVTNSTRSIVTDETVTLGFSLHYKDRLFLDVYTGSELFPQYLSGKVIDVRYCF